MDQGKQKQETRFSSWDTLPKRNASKLFIELFSDEMNNRLLIVRVSEWKEKIYIVVRIRLN